MSSATLARPDRRNGVLAGPEAPAAKPGRRWRGWSPAVIVLALILAALVGPPLYFIIKTSLFTTNADGSFGEFTLEYYGELFSTGELVAHFLNSVQFAVGSAIIAMSIGAGQAWIGERTHTPLREYVFLIAVVSLGIPHVLYTSAWLLILGKSGPVNALLVAAFDAPLINVYSMAGMILVEGMIWAPLGFLLLSSIFRSADGSYE